MFYHSIINKLRRIPRIRLFIGVVLLIAAVVVLGLVFFRKAHPEELESYLVEDRFLSADERFGIGGSLTGAKELGLVSMRGWGGNSGERQAIRQGLQAYFMTGKFDNPTYTSLNGLPGDGHPKCKTSATDSAIVNCIDVPDTGIPNDKSFPEIATIIAEDDRFKGQIWEIANEPDLGPWIFPEDYAVWFHMFEQEIHREENDPTAKIMNGGLFLPMHIMVAKPDGSLVQQNINWENFEWIKRFRDYYKTTYGVYPPVDVWNFHPYFWTDYAGFQSIPVVSFVDWDKYRITKVREFIDSLPEERGKPLYLTEMPLTIVFPCVGCTWDDAKALGQQEMEANWRKITKIGSELTNWLKSNNYTQKWHWFYWGAGPLSWTGGLNWIASMGLLKDHELGFFEDVEVPDLLAINYAKMAGSAKLFNPSFEAYPFNGKYNDYETGTDKYADYGWYYRAGGAGSGYTQTIVDGGHNKKSLKLHIGGSSPSSVIQRIPSSFYAGKPVKLSAWVKTTNGGKAGLKINTIGGSSVSVLPGGNYADWTKIETPAVVVPADAVGLEVEGMAEGNNGDVLFDDFELEVVEGPTPTPSPTSTPTPPPLSITLSNSSFEDCPNGGEVCTWGFWAGGPGSDYRAFTDTSQKHSGAKSAKIEVGQVPGMWGNTATINQQIPSSPFNGKKVKLSSWCKTANGGKAGMKINLINTAGAFNSYWVPGVLPERDCSSWTKIEKITTEVIPSDTAYLFIDGVAAGKNGDIWFDDFDLEVVGGPIPTPTPTPTPPPVCIGDLNNDGIVNLADLNLILQQWNTDCSSGCSGDIDSNGVVNILDIQMLLNNFNKNCE